MHYFLKSQCSQILVIEHDSEFWPVAWSWSYATVRPCVLSLIFFVCTYGGVSGGKFSLLQIASNLSHFQTNRGNMQFDSKFAWNLSRQMVLTLVSTSFRNCYTGASYLNLCINWHTPGAQNCSIHVLKLQHSEKSQFCECTPNLLSSHWMCS